MGKPHGGKKEKADSRRATEQKDKAGQKNSEVPLAKKGKDKSSATVTKLAFDKTKNDPTIENLKAVKQDIDQALQNFESGSQGGGNWWAWRRCR